MDGIGRLSAGELKRVTGTLAKRPREIVWHTAKIMIKQILTLDEYMSTIHHILTDCKTSDDEIIIELIDFAVRINVIASYAAIEIPEDIETLYYYVYASDLYDTICTVANRAQVESIWKSVKMYIGE